MGPDWLNKDRTEYSKCLGSLNWAWLLIPGEGTKVGVFDGNSGNNGTRRFGK